MLYRNHFKSRSIFALIMAAGVVLNQNCTLRLQAQLEAVEKY